MPSPIFYFFFWKILKLELYIIAMKENVVYYPSMKSCIMDG